MSTTKHIAEVDSAWATFLADADENQDGFINDHGMNMALYDGTNYYEWQPNRRWTGAAFEYLDGEYDDLMLYTKLSLGGSSGDPDMTITSTAGNIAISVDQNFSIATIAGGVDLTTVCGNVHIHAPAAYQAFIEGGSVKIAENTTGTSYIQMGVTANQIDIKHEKITLYTTGDIWDSDNERASMGLVNKQYGYIQPYSTAVGGIDIRVGIDTTGANVINLTALMSEIGNNCVSINGAVADGAGGLTSVATGNNLIQLLNNSVPSFLVGGDGDCAVLGGLAVGTSTIVTTAGRIQCSEAVYTPNLVIGTNSYFNAGSINIQVENASAYSDAFSYSDTATHSGVFQLAHYRGSVATPTVNSAGDRLGDVRWYGWSAGSPQIAAMIRGKAGTGWADTANHFPGYLEFHTAVDGGALTNRLTIAAAGEVTVAGAFGINGAAAQAAYASGGALAAYGTGAFGLDSGANMSALHALVVKIRAALVANGIMS